MGTIKAIIIGVSNYKNEKDKDLPFCKNDISMMHDALEVGLKVRKGDVIICGEHDTVNKNDFINAMNELDLITTSEDVLLFYFSGHGATDNGHHYLAFSDGMINTQKIIEYLEKNKARSKIILFDSCRSGNYEVAKKEDFDIEKTVESFLGKGYAVISSSNSSQFSYGHPEKNCSLFTYFLCLALLDKHIIKNGKKTFHDIQRLVSLFLEVWSKNNPDLAQKPICKTNMVGTLVFEVEEHRPYMSNDIYYETEKYIVSKVEPLHISNMKRYAIKVILKEPFSFREISSINLEIIKDNLMLDLYKNNMEEKIFKGKSTNIVWVYYGLDETEIENGFYLCKTTWVDDAQDKEYWYREGKNKFFIDSVFFHVNENYSFLKNFIKENTCNKVEFIDMSKEVLRNMVNNAEEIISLYNEYRNGLITEDDLFNNAVTSINEIDVWYLKSTNMQIAPNEIKAWDYACEKLYGTIDDFTLLYSKRFKTNRTQKNRQACMEDFIKRYYKDLEEVKSAERIIYIR